MSKARLIITAVVVEGRSQADVARSYGVSKGWVSKLVARYREQGETAFEPRSRRPTTSPTAIDAEIVDLIIRLRKQLSGQGLDAGPDTIAWHLQQHHQVIVSRATISRYLNRAGLVTPSRANDHDSPTSVSKPSSRTRPGRPTSPTTASPTAPTPRFSPGWTTTPYALSVTAHPRVTGPIVRDTFRLACAAHGVPASTLTDIQSRWCPSGARLVRPAAATPSKANYAACTSPRRTPPPTTPPPAEKSNASSRP